MNIPLRPRWRHGPQRASCAILLLAAALSAAVAAETGAERFARDCAGCHGADARGDGPQADRLDSQPVDLRKLAARNGSFPEDDVRRVIDGRDLTPAHGTAAMPVWGLEYNRSLAGQGERLVQERLDALIEYLRSIQEP